MTTACEERVNVAAFGGGSLDVVLLPGDMGPGHIPGETVNWSAEDETWLHKLSTREGIANLLHVGGDAINIATWLARQRGVAVNFSGIVGEGDPATTAICTELGRFGITNCAIPVPDYQPGIHIIERSDEPGSDRMVRRPLRPPEDPYISDTHIKDVVSPADLVVVASVKSPKLVRDIFSLSPESARLSYNPGSAAFKPESEVLPIMEERNPDLWAANIEEVRALFDAPDARVEDLALRAGRYATNVLITLGKEGIILAYNGQVARQRCQRLPKEKIVDKLGAGDRAHAVAAYYLLILGAQPEAVLTAVDEESTKVIQDFGGHGDLEKHVEPATFSLDGLSLAA